MAAASVDEYINGFSDEIRQILNEVRGRLLGCFPDADEGMNYGVPTIKIGKRMVHYAAFKKHLGLYPTPVAIEAFADELGDYETARGTIRFPFDQPIPYDLIERIAAYRMNEL